MKHTTLTPPTLKIAIVSAILGLGAVSGANAQTQSSEVFFPNIFDSDYTEELDSVYHNMILGNTAITSDEQYKFYADDGNEVPDSLFFNKMLHDQQLNGFKEGQKIIPLDKDGKPDYKLEKIKDSSGNEKQVYSITTKTATADDVANSPYAHGIQKDIDDLYDFDHQVTERLTQHGDKIWANEESVQYLNKEVQNLKADADASFETLTKNQNALIEQDEAINQELEGFAAHADVQDKQILQNQADIANNQADIANNINNIYELAQQQDQHASDIKNLGKASLTNTKRIATAELGIAENKKDALIAKAQADKNQIDIIKNKADADAKFKGVQTDIANNKTTLAQHTKKIDDNQKAIEAKLSGKVDTQTLVDLETKVKQNQGEVDKKLATVQENYNQLNTQVQSVDNKIGMVDTRINALDDKVENSMAAQAALNGLFQPYNVGKVSVSVAVGAYGSKSAIAVGAGYRVNPHLAFKGGAAINTSGSRKGSYNLGINYEF